MNSWSNKILLVLFSYPPAKMFFSFFDPFILGVKYDFPYKPLN